MTNQSISKKIFWRLFKYHEKIFLFDSRFSIYTRITIYNDKLYLIIIKKLLYFKRKRPLWQI